MGNCCDFTSSDNYRNKQFGFDSEHDYPKYPGYGFSKNEYSSYPDCNYFGYSEHDFLKNEYSDYPEHDYSRYPGYNSLHFLFMARKKNNFF